MDEKQHAEVCRLMDVRDSFREQYIEAKIRFEQADFALRDYLYKLKVESQKKAQ